VLGGQQTQPTPLPAPGSALQGAAPASAQEVQPVDGGLAAGAAHHSAVDHVFADLQASALADDLQGARILA
jgi:hypothetical protein